MYVYRALNDNDVRNNKIVAVEHETKPEVIMSKVVNHVRRGSNKQYSGCWISACRKFDKCAEEYAIPQNGNFNTATSRKNIAVIDISNWCPEVPNSHKHLSYTVFLDDKKSIIPQLCMRMYRKPDEKYSKGVCSRGIVLKKGIVGWTRRLLEQQAHMFKRELYSAHCLEYGILDCSLDRLPNPVPSIAELSYFDMTEDNKSKSHQYGIIKGYATAIDSGIVQEAKEVLFLNEIPQDMVIHILTPEQQDLYSIVSEKDRARAMKAMSDGTIQMGRELSNSEKPLFNGLLIDLLNDSSNIEIQYANLIQHKKQVLHRIAEKYGLEISEKNRIPEEGIIVKDITTSTLIAKKESYDLLAVRYNGKIYRFEKIENLKEAGVLVINNRA